MIVKNLLNKSVVNFAGVSESRVKFEEYAHKRSHLPSICHTIIIQS